MDRLGTLHAPAAAESTCPDRMSPRLALLLLAAASCGSSPDLEKELDTVRSWTATVRLAADERRAHATTAAYTAQLRDRATKALEVANHGIPQAARSAPDRERARAAVDSLALAVHLLDEGRIP
jgi:hypothetical protein